jgi:hypothetical protein
MTPNLESAEYLGVYKLRLTFTDGKVGEIEIEGELWGEVFEPLKDLELFKQFRVDAELMTIVWPSGADLAQEYLYRNAA